MKYKLLSDAILDGARLAPQARHTMLDLGGATCALGAAAHALTGYGEDYYLLKSHFADILDANVMCPVSDCDSFDRNILPPSELVITHLNDFHEWTREQIAAFVATVEESLGLCEIVSDEAESNVESFVAV